MINERKLLCAFIYSAYDSGYCGNLLGESKKQGHMELYKKYIEDEKYFPEKEIKETQKKMMDSVNSTSPREYIYEDHVDAVKIRIEEDFGKPFEELLESDIIRIAVKRCPVNFYKVINVEKNELKGKNLYSGIEKKLKILKGLEIPKIGDTISGHWDYVLEIVDDLPNFDGYRENLFEHLDKTKV